MLAYQIPNYKHTTMSSRANSSSLITYIVTWKGSHENAGGCHL